MVPLPGLALADIFKSFPGQIVVEPVAEIEICGEVKLETIMDASTDWLHVPVTLA